MEHAKPPETEAASVSAAQAGRLVHAVQAHHGQHVARLMGEELNAGKPPLQALASALSQSGVVRDGPPEDDNTRFTSQFSSRYHRE